jgi:hypothetical protein
MNGQGVFENNEILFNWLTHWLTGNVIEEGIREATHVGWDQIVRSFMYRLKSFETFVVLVDCLFDCGA